MERRRVSADCLADGDDDEGRWDDDRSAFGWASDKTMTEQRMSGLSAPAKGGASASGPASGGGGGGYGFDFGSLTSSLTSKTVKAPSVTKLWSQAVATVSATVAPSSPPGAPPQPANATTSTGGGIVNSVGLLAGAALGGASALAGGVNTALGKGPGTGFCPAAEIAVGIANAMVELMLCAPTCLDAENPQAELANQIDAVLAARSLNDLAARLLEYWFGLRSDVLSPWPLQTQSGWVKMAYAVKYGDLRRCPARLAKAFCGLLVQLGEGFRHETSTLETGEGGLWGPSLRRIAELCDGNSIPPGWCLPAMSIAQEANTGPGRPGYSISRADAKGVHFSRPKTLVAAVQTGARFAPRRSEVHLTRVTMDEAASMMGTLESLADAAGGKPLEHKCVEKGERLFLQKTQPIQFLNQASVPLKVCLFTEEDMLCAVPVGGVGGSCVVILDPNLRAQLRPPGKGHRFQLKVLAPGLIEKKLYMGYVTRGSSVQLRSHNCTCE